MATVITNPDHDRVGAIAARAGLRTSIASNGKMILNRAYTPKNCRAVAERLTGKKFGPRKNQEAMDALSAWIDEDDRKRVLSYLESNYGEAGLLAAEAVCLTMEDYRQGFRHCVDRILPALEEELGSA